jgi:putative ABC transport system substrate-binding protein
VVGQKGVRAIVVCLVMTVSLLNVFAANGQQPKIARVGVLTPASGAGTPVFEAFRKGLYDLGYLEGKNISIEYRFAAGKAERLPGLAEDLVNLKVDVIVTDGGAAARAAKQATTAIPIVMGSVGNPVEIGLVASLAQPGGNITGLTLLSRELSGKRLEILKEAFQKVTRIGVLWDSTTPGAKTVGLKEAEVAAQAIGVRLEPIEVRVPTQFESAFDGLIRTRSEAVMTLSSSMFWNHRSRIVELAVKSRLPAMFPEREFADEGGLLSYGPHVPDNFRRAAIYVDKILKGAKPADLPVEQPTKFEFVINLKTAKQIGLTIPPNVLARADRVIR